MYNYTVYFIHTVHFTLYSIRCTLYSVQCTVYSVQTIRKPDYVTYIHKCTWHIKSIPMFILSKLHVYSYKTQYRGYSLYKRILNQSLCLQYQSPTYTYKPQGYIPSVRGFDNIHFDYIMFIELSIGYIKVDTVGIAYKHVHIRALCNTNNHNLGWN